MTNDIPVPEPVDWTRTSDLTPEEITQMWAEAPVMYVSPAEYEQIMHLLEEPPRAVPELVELAERVKGRRRA